jgi:prepilin-type N-terminal cleavage/methylation domain-containing protein
MGVASSHLTPCPVGRAARRVRRAGFTLVELLVVLAVIVVLAALLLPVLSEARAKARQTRCLSQMRQIAQAHLLYLQDWDEQFPGWWQGGPPRPAPFGPYRFWPELLQTYAPHPTLFHDPSATPAEPTGQGAWLADYALLTHGPGGSGDFWDPYWRWASPPLSLAQVLRPAETIALTEGYTTTKDIRPDRQRSAHDRLTNQGAS